jgi:TonB-linked SusC/RagA family outer membrane protein
MGYPQKKMNSKNFNFRHIIATLAIMVWSFTSFAQNTISASGQITDDKGEPVVGAYVLQDGTNNGTITDADGKFTLTVPQGSNLKISCIGFDDILIAASTEMDIQMNLSTETLNEIVVVGYGTSVKKDLTTSVTSVRSKDFLQGAVNDPMQMIDGKVAGVTISSTAAADPNSSSSVQVRGAGSFQAGNSPLIVIDGMPGGDIKNLAQQDIESITVLKDGGAAAIYGSRAANGVILITTKSGKPGKTSISYDGYVEHDFIAATPDVLDKDDYLAKVNGAVDHGSNTDWYNELLNKDNFGHNHDLSISGGSETTVFRLSANYRNKEGLDIDSQREEYGLRGNFRQTTLKGLLEVSGNFSYRVANADECPDYGAFKMALQQNPTYDLESNEMGYSGYNYNPYNSLKDHSISDKYEYSTIDLNFRVNFLDNLYSELKVGRQGVGRNRYEYYNKYSRDCQENNYDGHADIHRYDSVDWTFEFTTNYNFKIAEKHDFKLMGGYSYQKFDDYEFYAENRDFPTDVFGVWNLNAGSYNKVQGRNGMGSYKSHENDVAFLGRLNYNYDDLVLFTGSLRYEGNSKFGEGNKWGLFPAASAAFRLSRLQFFQDIDQINDLKVRFSYGVTGRSGFSRYISLAKYTGFGMYWSDTYGKFIMGYGPGNNPNRDLKWEKQISYNLGVDYSLFDYRLSGSMDLFLREGKDLISDYSVPLPPYLHSTITTNVGTTQSKGFEFTANYQAIKTKDFTWTTNLTFSYMKTKLKKFSNKEYKLSYMEGSGFPSPGNPGSAQRLKDGTEIGTYYMSRYAGVDESGNILIWEDGIVGGTTKLGSDADETDKVYLNSSGCPKWEASWGNSFTYKGFDLYIFFRGKFDYKIMNQYEMYYGLQVTSGDNKLKSAYKKNAHIKGAKIMCDYDGFLQNGDYIRLDNVTLGYTPKIKTDWISNLRIYLTMKNLFTITDYTGLDVTNVNTNGIWPGIGGMEVYPSARSITLGVQISY